VPKPHPDQDAGRENLAKLSNDIDALTGLVRELAISGKPIAFAVAKLTLRIGIAKGRVYRALNPDSDDISTGDRPPTLAEAAERLAAARGRPQSWLTPEGLASARDVPEVIGPADYVKPGAESV
jgi:hypothetical protein